MTDAHHEQPEQASPRQTVLLAAFEGWNDAGSAATTALTHLAEVWGAEKVTELDPEEFHDFQVNRPYISLDDDGKRSITWPTTTISVAQVGERKVVLVHGVEPSMRWRKYCEELLRVADELGVRTVITLGALLADVPHTRPAPVTGSATDPRLVDELGLASSRYEGPTGIVGVLHDACRRADVPSASLWAAVPHYASLAASPKAALALCERLAGLLGTEFDLTDLERASAAYETQVSEAVAADEETAAYVQQLEERRDALGHELDVPSGETLAAELTRFLREHEARRKDETAEDEPS
jgi:proteasome assembly chaperone (PAC2) family protein